MDELLLIQEPVKALQIGDFVLASPYHDREEFESLDAFGDIPDMYSEWRLVRVVAIDSTDEAMFGVMFEDVLLPGDESTIYPRVASLPVPSWVNNAAGKLPPDVASFLGDALHSVHTFQHVWRLSVSTREVLSRVFGDGVDFELVALRALSELNSGKLLRKS